MNSVQLTIIGLGQIGASVGLSLASHTEQIQRVGHDRDPETARKAEKLGAVDHIQFNLHSAVENADIVLLAIPVDHLRSTLEQIAPDLKDGAMVLDTSGLNCAVSDWAMELLPKERYFASFTPTLNPAYLLEMDYGIDAAHADLFKSSLVYITCPAGTDPDAFTLAADLAGMLGARPIFGDALEIDGLAAAHNLLPKLAAAALVNATIDEPGWTEGRKVAGRAYAIGTEYVLHQDEDETLGQSAFLNKENAVRVINNLIANLQQLRDVVSANDAEGLSKLLLHAREGRETWWRQRQTDNWAGVTAAKLPTSSEVMGRFFGLNLRNLRKKNQDK
jgi:prephenate dehydrogenase